MRVSWVRITVQALFFALFLYAGLLGLRRLTVMGHELSLPTLSCEYARHKVAKCYLHDLQAFVTRGASDRYLSLIEPTLFFLFFVLVLGRAWCGWACPLGFIQDVAAHGRSALGLRHWRAGRRAKEVFAFSGYALLGLTVVIALFIGRPESRLYRYAGSLYVPFCQICPGRQILPLLQGDPSNFFLYDRFTGISQTMSVLAMGTVLLFLIGLPAMRRFWCRICVLGIFMDFLRVNRWSLARLKKDARRCTYCGACERACPVDITVVYETRESGAVRPPDCHLCLKCVEACPEDDALQAQIGGRNVVRSKFAYVHGKIGKSGTGCQPVLK